MSCAWCHGPDGVVERLVFDIAAFRQSDDQYGFRLFPSGVFGATEDPLALCVTDREWRYEVEWDGPKGEWCLGRHELAHRCACGHSSSYHSVTANLDHGLMAAAGGVDMCRACARFVAVATRRRLGRTERQGWAPEPLDIDEVDELFDDPLRDLTEREVATAARKFFRKFEGAST